uniref:Uncharacterized protein n=1 Tax=Branchiostoma floridae TaxID=7739 RepID=C3ZVB0_BRAFL|eukprot:XP_002587489.1 hypothetical protein BRAFLDRAFT_99380 [Branchiostoma floridae]
MPKRAKKCPGCGQDNSLHPNGRGNKQCKGISQPVHSDTESVETTPPAGGKVKATADLERRKAELQEQLTQARLEKEVAELEEELQKARCSTEPAKETDPTLPKPTELHKTDPAHTSLLGPGDITLQQLRDNSPLQAQVTAKYPDLIGSRKKTEGKTLSPEAFVYSFESAEPKKYDELTMEEFLVVDTRGGPRDTNGGMYHSRQPRGTRARSPWVRDPDYSTDSSYVFDNEDESDTDGE